MEHKAFVFDYASFESDLLPILYEALRSNDSHQLVRFIERNKPALTDPYEGAPLDESWEALVETHDEHQYGDFALTKYYDCTEDIGLGPWGRQIDDTVDEYTRNLFLGDSVGPRSNVFDPGKLGSYIQNPSQVQQNYQTLITSAAAKNCEWYEDALTMFEPAVTREQGIYVTF